VTKPRRPSPPPNFVVIFNDGMGDGGTQPFGLASQQESENS